MITIVLIICIVLAAAAISVISDSIFDQSKYSHLPEVKPIPRAHIEHSPIMSMVERKMGEDYTAHVIAKIELKTKRVLHQQWYQEHRILIVDGIHRSSVQVSIPDKNADDNRIEGKADALIYALWVDEPYRKQGVARKLLETAEREAKKMGCKTVCLEWDRRESDEWVLRWYERLGYNEKEFGRHSSLLVKEL
nr:MAG TPA: acetyltransferase domain containing protein [Caudoviricetes sp.]